jgi:hypothetical protein
MRMGMDIHRIRRDGAIDLLSNPRETSVKHLQTGGGTRSAPEDSKSMSSISLQRFGLPLDRITQPAER